MNATFNTAATRMVSVDGTKFAYREIGDKRGIPIVFLHHFTAVLDDWDPAIVDGLPNSRPVIIFDNRDVGGSEGEAPELGAAAAPVVPDAWAPAGRRRDHKAT
jgi:pimeloyl-ACP methyl ester carboxylesterase